MARFASCKRNRQEKQIGEEEMATDSNHRGGDLRPAILAAHIAIASIVGILLNDFRRGNASHDSAAARMITAATLSRAGAIETPTERSINALTFQL
jgi:hypothetical protein